MDTKINIRKSRTNKKDMDKICGIYKITNIINGKVYIGQSIDIDKRWKDHKRMLKNNTHHSAKLQRAWNKYGCDKFSFDIIDVCEDVLLDEYEMKNISKYDSILNGYNMTGVDSHGNFTNEKLITQKQKETLRAEWYDRFKNIISMYDDDVKLEGKYYREKMLTGTAGYIEYMKVTKLLYIMYENLYKEKDNVEVSYLFKSIRVANRTTNQTIFYEKKKPSSIRVYHTGCLEDKHSTCFKINDLLNNDKKCDLLKIVERYS